MVIIPGKCPRVAVGVNGFCVQKSLCWPKKLCCSSSSFRPKKLVLRLLCCSVRTHRGCLARSVVLSCALGAEPVVVPGRLLVAGVAVDWPAAGPGGDSVPGSPHWRQRRCGREESPGYPLSVGLPQITPHWASARPDTGATSGRVRHQNLGYWGRRGLRGPDGAVLRSTECGGKLGSQGSPPRRGSRGR